MTDNKQSARSLAFSSLMRCERDKSYSNLEIDSSIRRNKLSDADKRLYTALVYGVIERKLTLDYIISRLSSKPLEALDAEVLTATRMGLYQLIWLDRVPDSAAVNESVALIKAVKPRSASFVNALLREFGRRYSKDELPYPDKSDYEKYLSVRYSCGEDIVRTLENYGAEPILAAFEEQPPVTLRVNTLKLTRDELLAELAKEDIPAEPTILSPFGIKLKKRSIPEKITELISGGYVFIQDEASQIAAMALDPKPGEVVIDACACPGGKSFSAAMLMENRGKILAFDLHKNKLSLIMSGAKRLGIDIIEAGEKNGAVFDEALAETADALICDAPCSGLGVIAKKPEIRYKSAAEYSRLPEVQYSILSNCSRYLKPGGRLCYSTCTLNPDENQGVVSRFLSENSSFEPLDFRFGELHSERGMLTLLPQEQGTDGFFISLLRKKS